MERVVEYITDRDPGDETDEVEVEYISIDDFLDLVLGQNLTGETFVDDFGTELVNVHLPNEDCYDLGCSVHHPTEHAMASWPRKWRVDTGRMERICPHGIGHPDPDEIAYLKRASIYEPWMSIHGCDGCCS